MDLLLSLLNFCCKAGKPGGLLLLRLLGLSYIVVCGAIPELCCQLAAPKEPPVHDLEALLGSIIPLEFDAYHPFRMVLAHPDLQHIQGCDAAPFLKVSAYLRSKHDAVIAGMAFVQRMHC